MGFFVDPFWDWFTAALIFGVIFGLSYALRHKRIVIREDQRAFHFRDGRFIGVKGPGVYWTNARDEFDIDDIAVDPMVKSVRVELVMSGHLDALQKDILRIDIPEGYVGLLRIEGHPRTLLAPNSIYYFWKDARRVEADIIDTRGQAMVDPKILFFLLKHERAGDFYRLIATQKVADSDVGVLIVNGVAERLLEPGLHGFWRTEKDVEIRTLDIDLRALSVGGQDMLTRDRIGLRINLLAHYRIVDPILTVRTAAFEHETRAYEFLQLALRAAVAGRMLDEILDERAVLDTELAQAVRPAFESLGLHIEQVGIKDIILPGEVRTIMNKVVEAERAAQANLIRRREETAATRSLLNTAKLMEDNPVLLRLKELETLEKVVEKVGTLHVTSSMGGLLNDLVKIKADQK